VIKCPKIQHTGLIMTIRVLSFDFDGCLFNLNYINSYNKDVIKSNQAFLDKIKAQNAAYKKVYTFVGSNRQSYLIDIYNSYGGKGSCFPSVGIINKYLGGILDTFLLADIYGDLPDGTSFKNAINKDYKGEHSQWLFDETKASIMYAQIHKVANENLNEEIVLDFYDDRGNGARTRRDILEQLKEFYTKYPELIPNNVTLRLHHYTGGAVTLMAEIKGTGFIDSNYKQTVKDMAAQSQNDYNTGISQPIYVADKVDPKLLVNRKARTSSIPEPEGLYQKITIKPEELPQKINIVAPKEPEVLPKKIDIVAPKEPEVLPQKIDIVAPDVPATVVTPVREVSPQPLALKITPTFVEKEAELEAAKKQRAENRARLEAAKQRFEAAAQAIDLKEADLLAEKRAPFDAALRAIDLKADELRATAIKLDDNNFGDSPLYFRYIKAETAARTLHKALDTAAKSYYVNGDKQAFKKTADLALETALNSELKNHRGGKELLGYLGLAVLALLSIATLGLAYAVAGAVNYAVNRQFFFSSTFNTDSINRVEQLKKEVDAIPAPTI
jgi:hypothetical protein